MKILIAEDDTVSRRLLEATLSTFGFEVILAANGAQAWAVLQGEDPPSLGCTYRDSRLKVRDARVMVKTNTSG